MDAGGVVRGVRVPPIRHFKLDANGGAIELGPAVRQPDGGWTQYGAIPPQGAELRMSAYRYGGGRVGNVAADTLTMLRSAIPGVASVTNPRPAYGGVDPEALESARQRAAMEIRTRYRAVTAEDFEFLVTQASSRVGQDHLPAAGERQPTRFGCTSWPASCRRTGASATRSSCPTTSSSARWRPTWTGGG